MTDTDLEVRICEDLAQLMHVHTAAGRTADDVAKQVRNCRDSRARTR